MNISKIRSTLLRKHKDLEDWQVNWGRNWSMITDHTISLEIPETLVDEAVALCQVDYIVVRQEKREVGSVFGNAALFCPDASKRNQVVLYLKEKK